MTKPFLAKTSLADLAASLANLSVLVIEDEAFTRSVLIRMLSALGCRKIYQAEDGVGGLKSARDHRPDIVLCDVEMRPIDGLGFLSGLREDQDEALREAPVMFMTNRIDPAVVDAAKAYGVFSFLAKPVSSALLKDHLLQNIMKSRSALMRGALSPTRKSDAYASSPTC